MFAKCTYLCRVNYDLFIGLSSFTNMPYCKYNETAFSKVYKTTYLIMKCVTVCKKFEMMMFIFLTRPYTDLVKYVLSTLSTYFYSKPLCR